MSTGADHSSAGPVPGRGLVLPADPVDQTRALARAYTRYLVGCAQRFLAVGPQLPAALRPAHTRVSALVREVLARQHRPMLGCFASPLSAELTETVEHLDRGSRGISDEVTISRDGARIYVRSRRDLDRNGSYEHHLENFYIEGRLALQFTFVAGSRGTVVPAASRAQVIRSSGHDSWQPQGIMIESDNKASEYFDLQPDGFYRPVTDEEKRRRA